MTNNFTPAKAGQQSKRLSKEEYAEKMKAEKEAVYQMADDTAKAIVSDPEKFKAFLDTQSRLDRYSAVNALLIFKQLPEASQLKNFDDWSKDNVKIQKGAKSISILEPVEYAKKDGTTGISYNVKKVFDIAQTDAKRQPQIHYDDRLLLSALISKRPVPIEMAENVPNGAAYDYDRRTVIVQRGMDGQDLFRCVSLAMARAELDQTEHADPQADAFRGYCVSYMLCRKYGVDARGYDFSRLPESLRDADSQTIRSELTDIRDTLQTMTGRMERALEQSRAAAQKNVRKER